MLPLSRLISPTRTLLLRMVNLPFSFHCLSRSNELYTGHPISRVKAQQAFAGFIGGFVDRAIETKGFDYLHRDSVKAHAQQRVEPLLDGIYPA